MTELEVDKLFTDIHAHGFKNRKEQHNALHVAYLVLAKNRMLGQSESMLPSAHYLVWGWNEQTFEAINAEQFEEVKLRKEAPEAAQLELGGELYEWAKRLGYK